jgi:hypothetical protein
MTLLPGEDAGEANRPVMLLEAVTLTVRDAGGVHG